MYYSILTAFSVKADTMKEAQEHLMTLLPEPDLNHNNIDCWWIAEDERYDNNDCDSAVFCAPGQQGRSRADLANQKRLSDNTPVVMEVSRLRRMDQDYFTLILTTSDDKRHEIVRVPMLYETYFTDIEVFGRLLDQAISVVHETLWNYVPEEEIKRAANNE